MSATVIPKLTQTNADTADEEWRIIADFPDA